MKTKLLLYSLILIPFLFSNCKKDNEVVIPKLDPEADCFTTYIDGVLLNPEKISGTNTALFLITTTIVDPDLQVFLFQLTNTSVGTYAISDQSGFEAKAKYSFGTQSTLTEFVGTSGSITIEEHDTPAKRIKGIFNFEGDDVSSTNKITVTQGVFDLKYS